MYDFYSRDFIIKAVFSKSLAPSRSLIKYEHFYYQSLIRVTDAVTIFVTLVLIFLIYANSIVIKFISIPICLVNNHTLRPVCLYSLSLLCHRSPFFFFLFWHKFKFSFPHKSKILWRPRVSITRQERTPP